MRILLSLLLLLGTALAELPETPHPQTRDIHPSFLVLRPEVYHKTFDTPFLIFHGISLAGALADGYISHKYIHPENGCREVNPFLGHYPSAAKTYGMTLGTWAVVTTVDALLKRAGKSWWYMPATSETAVHLVGIRMTYSACDGPHNFQ
jgi:hypothetical protein